MTWYVYGLFDACVPHQIRYVGQTANLKSRMMSHRCSAIETTEDWNEAVIASGSIISVLVLEQCKTERKARIAESRWMSKLSGLLNKNGSGKRRETSSGKHL